jgi:hypothetical protein
MRRTGGTCKQQSGPSQPSRAKQSPVCDDTRTEMMDRMLVQTKEVNKEQPSYRNLSDTARRVLQSTYPVAASRQYFSANHTSPHLTSTHITPDYVNTIILHLESVLYTAVNVWNKYLCRPMCYELFSLFGISFDH